MVVTVLVVIGVLLVGACSRHLMRGCGWQEVFRWGGGRAEPGRRGLRTSV